MDTSKKLFSCLYGSRLYGTQTPTSDLDLKHIYLPKLGDLLLCKEVKNKVKNTNKELNTRNGPDDVDEEFIPLQVFARDFFAGQTYAIELAFAVEGTHAEQTLYHDISGDACRLDDWHHRSGPLRSHFLFVPFVRELRASFLTSNIRAMMGYVVNQVSLYSFKGERLNAVNDFMSVLIDHAVIDETHRVSECAKDPIWDDLLKQHAKYIKREEYDVGGGQMKPCFKLLEKTIPFTDTLEHAIMVVSAQKSKYGARAEAASEHNVDWKATMHAIRILEEGLNLLTEKKLEFPFSPEKVAELLKVKAGNADFEVIKFDLNAKLNQLKQLEQTTDLPAHSPELTERFEKWLEDWLFDFYGLRHF